MILLLSLTLLASSPCWKVEALLSKAEQLNDTAERMQYHDITYARVLFYRAACYRLRAAELQACLDRTHDVCSCGICDDEINKPTH